MGSLLLQGLLAAGGDPRRARIKVHVHSVVKLCTLRFITKRKNPVACSQSDVPPRARRAALYAQPAGRLHLVGLPGGPVPEHVAAAPRPFPGRADRLDAPYLERLQLRRQVEDGGEVRVRAVGDVPVCF